MSKALFIYLAIGIFSRAVFFIYSYIARKKYNLGKYNPLPMPIELIAHALDVVGWPFATFVSFYLIRKCIKMKKEES